MEIRVLNTFLRASQTESFSKAAEDLGYSQAAVTLQIKQLEEELGVVLFERIGKRVKLTDKGAEFAETTAELLNDLEDAIYRLNDEKEVAGKLTIAASESMCDVFLPIIIAEYIKKYPRVEVSVVSGADYTFYDMLQRNEVDLAIISDGLEANSAQLTSVVEQAVPVVFVAASNNPLVKKKKVKLSELLEQPFISTEKDMYARYDLEHLLQEQGINTTVKPIVNAASTNFIIELLSRSDALAFLPAYVANRHIASGRISIINCPEVKYETTTRMVHHRNKVVTPQMKAFLQVTEEVISKIYVR